MKLKSGLRRSRKIGKIWRDGEDRINVLMNSMGVQCTDVAFENGESETENQLKDFRLKKAKRSTSRNGLKVQSIEINVIKIDGDKITEVRDSFFT